MEIPRMPLSSTLQQRIDPDIIFAAQLALEGIHVGDHTVIEALITRWKCVVIGQSNSGRLQCADSHSGERCQA
ncbi:hypothetical protein A5643_09885 [Mycobacterium sp. 1274756.6]|nr:hypothetical protein A5643_09885 [Mycobacterium sp. 1274756.6]